ncbi:MULTISPECIES: glycoside hydrolase family 3 N-terminal domain-containing protein [unclassified Amycolatopsis]|uniref:glycoside hydrolase family 3 protein n=1 Tax=unclassified Amycolatopsis TaxID=2618356 RepID=UPI002874E856|nr:MULTISPECIES: glycoside hydrolase family 3 N-terminal domain-containing protein [unclassified Amycolatopsis]MDS0135196.1 glycoside hydrolase family 3 C-terminal domain-containing protein [Amycolatopsis sp. 505]MDS0143027.1 glycoside hydrolase family 3 C-terminal domain-containing protein [Amycolatopsis sp. CM201R]
MPLLRTTRSLRPLALAGLLFAGTALVPMASASVTPLYKDSRASVADRVTDLMARMTLDDKVGQMTEGERGAATPAQSAAARLGSILSGGGSTPSPNTPAGWADMVDAYQRAATSTGLGIPLVYGSDTVHGHNNAAGATIFPHNIGLGAANDPQLVRQIGAITAQESAATGVKWGFAPCLCVARDDRWGRTYESFGEVPDNAVANSVVIEGLQGSSLGNTTSIMATAKHFIGDGGTTGGVDQGNTQIGLDELRRIHLPPFQAAIAHGVGSVMISFNSWNGVKDHGNKFLVTDLLKTELGFSGYVISDWNGIDQIDGRTGFTAAEVSQAVNAGIDMVMVPNDYLKFISTLKAEVLNGHVPMSRIDDANRRILTKKFELGLFERPYTDRSLQADFGSAAHHAVARQATRESQVLLKNDGVLPLAKQDNRIFVAGKNANDLGNQAGGWTLSWQGQSGTRVIPGTTILDGIKAGAGKGTVVTYDRAGSGINSGYKVAVAVVGETPYAEGQGDRPGGVGLDAEDVALIGKLKASGVPLVVVTVSGRPLDIAAELPSMKGLVAAWLPGSEGAGVADVLYGDYNPAGKLSFTWPAGSSQEPINTGDGKQGLFPYGFGLSYRR